MNDFFLGSVVLFGGNFAPQGWMFCQGQMLNINQYQALYSLIGNTYGGSSGSFALPDLRGAVPIGFANKALPAGNGLTARAWGEKGGSATVALTAAQLPAHTHGGGPVPVTGVSAVLTPSCSTLPGTAETPVDNIMSAPEIMTDSGSNDLTVDSYANAAATSSQLQGMTANATPTSTATAVAGSGQPLSIMQPTLALNYIICVAGGYYPSRS